MVNDSVETDNEHVHRWPAVTFARVVVAVLVGVALLWLTPIIATFVADIDLDDVRHPYLIMSGFVVIDAVLPVFPSEVLLNTASTLAAQDDSSFVLWRIIVAGWVGAVVGDTLLYWLSRTVLRRSMAASVVKAESNPTVAQAVRVLKSTAPVVIVFGRFIPGVRFAVGASLGLSRFPYLRFLRWDIVGGGFWATYTCVSSYLIATLIEGRPVISLAVSAVVTTAILALLFRPLKANWQAAGAEPAPV